MTTTERDEPASDKQSCPKCGAGREKNLPARYDCQSYLNNGPTLPFQQSSQCRIRELTSDRDRLAAELADVETNADPAGTVRQWRLTIDENAMLREKTQQLAAELAAVRAEAEGLRRVADAARGFIELRKLMGELRSAVLSIPPPPDSSSPAKEPRNA
jgi:hypothetical protein